MPKKVICETERIVNICELERSIQSARLQLIAIKETVTDNDSFLEGRGFQHVGTWRFEDARKLIDRIAANSWRIPHDIVPNKYTPEHKEAMTYAGW